MTQEGETSMGYAGEGTAFTINASERLPIPILIAAPHGGRAYPEAVVTEMRRPEWSQLRLEDRHIDTLACAVAEATDASLLVAHTPRAIIDLNRAPDDIDWSMIADRPEAPVMHSLANRRARSGLGLVPRRLPGLGEIWRGRLKYDDLQKRLEDIHFPYHSVLEQEMQRIRDRWGAALLVDLHSMPPLRANGTQEKPAEFVIGDRFGSSCDGILSGRALNYLARYDRRVSHNRPYSGGYILDRHGSPRRGLHAIQIEVCRSAYLDASFRDMSARASGVVRLLAGLVRALAQDVAAIGGEGNLPIASE